MGCGVWGIQHGVVKSDEGERTPGDSPHTPTPVLYGMTFSRVVALKGGDHAYKVWRGGEKGGFVCGIQDVRPCLCGGSVGLRRGGGVGVA